MNVRFSGRICQLMPAANMWSLDWIAGMMLRDLLGESAGWRVQTAVTSLPFDHPAYGFRADNTAFQPPVKLFAQADEEGMGQFEGRQSYNVIVQANFETPTWGPGVKDRLIPEALAAMQATFAAASPGTQFWFPMR